MTERDVENVLKGFGIAMIAAWIFIMVFLSMISYQENKQFCEIGSPNCRDPWIPIINM